MRQQPEVEVFTSPTCGDCQAAKEFLQKHQIRFREMPVDREPNAAELMKRSGRAVVPTIYVDGEQFTGFSNNRTRIMRALGIDPPNVH